MSDDKCWKKHAPTEYYQALYKNQRIIFNTRMKSDFVHKFIQNLNSDKYYVNNHATAVS